MYKYLDLHIKIYEDKNKTKEKEIYLYNIKDVEFFKNYITFKDNKNTSFIYKIKDIIYIYTLK